MCGVHSTMILIPDAVHFLTSVERYYCRITFSATITSVLIVAEFYAAVSSKDGYRLCFSGVYNLSRSIKHIT
jgi:hypothetical protein